MGSVARFFIERRIVTAALTAVLLLGGIQAFRGMSRLEDPEFTIKDALVVTPYPGASATEVEEEVTDEIEQAVQSLGQVKEIVSKSDRGLSTVTVTIRDQYRGAALAQVWDELRRKVNDAQGGLPPGAGPSRVIDDYGDVYGVFIAVSGAEYDYAERKQVVDRLRRELLLVTDVAKIETFGERQEAVYVEPDRDRMSQLGIPPQAIAEALRQKNVVADAGRVRVGPEFVVLEPTGVVRTVADFEDILITSGSERQVFLRDVAEIWRGYVEPPTTLLRYDGAEAIGLGISTTSGGNVVEMGRALERRFQELLSEIPLGIEIDIISLQSRAVTQAVSGFTTSLLQAVAIVVVVLLFFMGLRSGLIIGFVLFVTIAGSFLFLAPWGVALERISLGALIIALGMLVDNAIVVVDGVLVRVQQGEEPKPASMAVVAQSALPLLGATVIAILAFAAIGTSDDSTGEFCRSLFQVVLVSLLLSWVTAITLTPLLCVAFLRAPGPGEAAGAAAERGFLRRYRRFLALCIRRRGLTVLAVGLLFVLALRGFGLVEKSFFPPSTRSQFMVDLWLPEGTHLEETRRAAERAEEILREQEGVTHVTSLVGKGGLRFLLTYTPEKQNSAYAQLLVDVEDAARIDALLEPVERRLLDEIPALSLTYATKFQLGPGSSGKIQAQFSGPDAAVLRRLADDAAAILEADPDAKSIRTDWRQRVKAIHAEIAEEEASKAGVGREDVARVLRQAFEGERVGVFRDGDLLLPIVVRAEQGERDDVASLAALQIWSPTAQRTIPLRQVVARFETTSEDQIVIREDRTRTVTVFADPREGPASVLFARVRPDIEALPLPPGYGLEWAGEYEDSRNAQGPLFAALPVFLVAMILVTIALFDSLRLPLVIWLNVPLALIGVVLGLLLTRQPFGFMALLGFLSLIGMLIKNAIVLIDEIEAQRSAGKAPLPALLDAGVSRLRPVAMAASTTALGMLPLLADAFFVAMAVTIVFGLMIATVLTMVVLPVFYAILFRIDSRTADR
ncbi:efflux RND transporter permease subunit [Myxococcota bacterium]|nr:efflux RND transporter permease subunit [Myxococcota bacterium]MCZ7617068.1 efflux RND transporter permease subunit [Myxococcota bacterium]